MKMPYGKYKDWDVSDVPREYLEWLHTKTSEDSLRLKAELDRRAAIEESRGTWIDQIIKAGYRALASKHHPDVGGTDADMKEINASNEKLKQMVKDARL